MRRITILGLGLLTLGACGKDRNLDDYNRELLQQDLSRLKGATGEFSGVVNSLQDGSPLGAMKLTLTPQINSSPTTKNPDGMPASPNRNAQTSLIASVEFYGHRSMTVNAQNSYFDDTTRQFHTSIVVTRKNQQTAQIDINGFFSDEHFEGTVGVPAFVGSSDSSKRYGGQFSLVKNGPSPASLAAPLLKGSGAGTPQEPSLISLSYTGTTEFQSTQASKPVTLVILEPSVSPEEDLLNVLSPLKPVQLILNYGDSVSIVHDDAEWDALTGQVTGNTLVNSFQLYTKCQKTKIKQSDGWDCRHFVTSQASKEPTAKTLVWDNGTPSTSGNDPIQGRRMHALQFQGTATYGDQTEAPVTLTAVYPALTRQQELMELFFPVAEKFLDIAISIGTKAPSIAFDHSKWDLHSASLDGIAQFMVSNEKFDLTLRCEDFHFDSKKVPFHCSYYSNHLAAPIRLELRTAALAERF